MPAGRIKSHGGPDLARGPEFETPALDKQTKKYILHFQMLNQMYDKCDIIQAKGGKISYLVLLSMLFWYWFN